jgi:hypothetical protein
MKDYLQELERIRKIKDDVRATRELLDLQTEYIIASRNLMIYGTPLLNPMDKLIGINPKIGDTVVGVDLATGKDRTVIDGKQVKPKKKSKSSKA